MLKRVKFVYLLLVFQLMVVVCHATDFCEYRNASVVFNNAKIEDKQILFEFLSSKDENSLLKSTQIYSKYRNAMNVVLVIEGSKLYHELKFDKKGIKFLLVSNDKQLKSYIKSYDILMIENQISLFFSTLNIKKQIDYLVKINNICDKKAQMILGEYYAKHDKKKNEQTSVECFLKRYTLNKEVFSEFQNSYIKNWSN